MTPISRPPPHPAVTAGKAMAELAMAALLGVLLQRAGGAWMLAWPFLLAWTTARSVALVKARADHERSSIALYRMLGGSFSRLAGRLSLQALLAFAPSLLVALLAAGYALPLGSAVPAILAPLLGIALTTCLHAIWTAYRIAPAYGASMGDDQVLRKLYGPAAPAREKLLAHHAHLRSLHAPFAMLVLVLVLSKRPELPFARHDDDTATAGNHEAAIRDDDGPADVSHGHTVELRPEFLLAQDDDIGRSHQFLNDQPALDGSGPVPEAEQTARVPPGVATLQPPRPQAPPWQPPPEPAMVAAASVIKYDMLQHLAPASQAPVTTLPPLPNGSSSLSSLPAEHLTPLHPADIGHLMVGDISGLQQTSLRSAAPDVEIRATSDLAETPLSAAASGNIEQGNMPVLAVPEHPPVQLIGLPGAGA